MAPDRVRREADVSEPTYSAAASVSRATVGLMSRYTGRGPTKARTTLNTNFALVVLEDTLTKGERSLVAAGESEAVRRQRDTFHRVMRDEVIAAVEEITRRRVRACLNDITPEDGIAVLVFLFDAVPEVGGVAVANADVTVSDG